MITTPTVLVLGAGASMPYGFPSAAELMALICEKFRRDSTACRLLAGYTGMSCETFSRFREELRKAGQVSVDAFLEHRREWISVGKLVIAYCLMPFEDEEKCFSSDADRGGDWYQYLFGKLNARFEEFAGNLLSVVTFNYDRSLEHYLLTALQNKYGQNRHECIRTLSKIRIVHVYGQLSVVPYPDVERNSNSYLPNLPKEDPFIALGCAAEGIKILHEENQPLVEAQKLLSSAERICFLGFHYHALNVSRLTIDAQNTGSKKIFGSTRGLIGDEIPDAVKRIHAALGSTMTVREVDNLEMLRRYMVLG